MPYGEPFFRLSLALLSKHIPIAGRGKSEVGHGKTLLLEEERVKNEAKGERCLWLIA